MILTAEVEHPDGTTEIVEVLAPDQIEAAKLVQQMLGYEEPRDFKLKDPRSVYGTDS